MKTKRFRRYIPTRRKRTLRRFALLLVVSILLATGLIPFNFTPVHGLRDWEENWLFGPTEIDRLVALPLKLPGRWRCTLSESENAVSFCAQRFDPLAGGWNPIAGAAADCKEDPTLPVHATYCTIRHGNEIAVVVFGRVEDERAANVQLTVEYQSAHGVDESLTMSADAHGQGLFCKTISGAHRIRDGEPVPFRILLECYREDDAPFEPFWSGYIEAHSVSTILD